MNKTISVLLVCLISIGVSRGQDDCKANIKAYYNKSNFERVLETVSTCYPDSSYEKDIEKIFASSLFKTGRQKAAKKLCETILEKADSLHYAHQILAQIYELEENPPRAIKHYLYLHKADTTNVQLLKKLAALYLRSGDQQSAFSYYQKAHVLNREDIGVMAALAELFLENDQINEADSLLDLAYYQDSNNVKVLLLSARVLYMEKDYSSAVKRLARANKSIDFSQYFNKLYGYALLRIDSLDKSIYFLEKALVGERTNREYAHYYLAIAYEKKEMPDYAVFHYERAIGEGISENTSTYFKNLGLVHEKNNQFSDAIRSYKKGLDWNEGKDDIILFYLARAADQYYKDKSIAVRYYSKYIESNDQDAKLKKYAIERMNYLREVAHMKQ